MTSSDLRLNRYYLRLGDRLHKLNPIPPKGTLHLHLKFTNRRQLARGLSTSEAAVLRDWEAILFFLFGAWPRGAARSGFILLTQSAFHPRFFALRIACCLTFTSIRVPDRTNVLLAANPTIYFRRLVAPMICVPNHLTTMEGELLLRASQHAHAHDHRLAVALEYQKRHHALPTALLLVQEEYSHARGGMCYGRCHDIYPRNWLRNSLDFC